MFAGSFFLLDLVLDLDLRIVDLDTDLNLAVAGLVTSLQNIYKKKHKSAQSEHSSDSTLAKLRHFLRHSAVTQCVIKL